MTDLKKWLYHDPECDAAAWEQRNKYMGTPSYQRPACTCGLDAQRQVVEEEIARLRHALNNCEIHQGFPERTACALCFSAALARVQALEAEVSMLRSQLRAAEDMRGLAEEERVSEFLSWLRAEMPELRNITSDELTRWWTEWRRSKA